MVKSCTSKESLENNHELSEVRIIVYVTKMFIYYRKYNSCRKYFVMPKQRHLDSEAKLEAVKLRANKKLVQYHLMSLTSKTMILKDIHNIAGKAVPAFRNGFQELVEKMRKVKGEVPSMGKEGCLCHLKESLGIHLNLPYSDSICPSPPP